MTALLRARDLAIALKLPGGSRILVEGLTFALEAGRTLALVGESGSGKSLTALALLGLLPAEAFSVTGSLVIQDRECLGLTARAWIALRGRVVGMVFQEPFLALSPRMTVGRQIGEVLQWHFGLSRAGAWLEAVRWLDRVGIPQATTRASDYPSAFSGGMRQRICIAMALAAQPRILVADEPTTALDTPIQAQILDLIQGLRKEMGLSVLLITHDLALARERSEDLLVLYGGRPMEAGPTAAVLGQPRHRYTRALLDCARFPAEAGQPLVAIPGHPPLVTPQAIPPCVFADRCGGVQADCGERPYVWFQEEPGRGHACLASSMNNLVIYWGGSSRMTALTSFSV